MNPSPALAQLDIRLREAIVRTSPCERFQRLDEQKVFDAELHATLRAEGVW